jgi:hypothetical protein
MYEQLQCGHEFRKARPVIFICMNSGNADISSERPDSIVFTRVTLLSSGEGSEIPTSPQIVLLESDNYMIFTM